MRKKDLCIGLVALFLLSGCQQTPGQNAVVSKNDGAFDANVIVSASEHHDPDETQTIQYSETFTSTDGSVTFLVAVDEEVTAADMPVLEAVPHFLTAEDAKRVAHALFGDVVFYEPNPVFAEVYTKSEIQEKINRWMPYTSLDACTELFGFEIQSDVCNTVKEYIEKYTQLYEVAPEEDSHELCRWELRKDSEYWYPADELVGKDLSGDNDEIKAQTSFRGYPYTVTISNRDKSDFKINMVFADLYDEDSPYGISTDIFRAELSRTAKPTETQIAAIRERAATMLEDMELGQWKIDECYVETTYKGSIPEYTVCVNAVPVLNGMAVIRQPQLGSLRGEDAYSASYYYTDVNFIFAPNGELISFVMYSPLEVKETLNPNVAVKSIEELMEAARQYLRNTDAYAYNYLYEVQHSMIQEEVDCTVTVTKLEYNLVRVKVPMTEANYYYVPGIVLKGTAEYTGKESGKLYYTSEDLTLVSLNGVDGSVVQTVE